MGGRKEQNDQKIAKLNQKGENKWREVDTGIQWIIHSRHSSLPLVFMPNSTHFDAHSEEVPFGAAALLLDSKSRLQ